MTVKRTLSLRSHDLFLTTVLWFACLRFSGARSCNGTLMHLSEDAVLESFAREHLTLVHRFAALASAATVEQQARIQVEEPTLASNHESTVATVPDLARIERVYRSAYAQAIQALPDSLRAALERNQIKWYSSLLFALLLWRTPQGSAL